MNLNKNDGEDMDFFRSKIKQDILKLDQTIQQKVPLYGHMMKQCGSFITKYETCIEDQAFSNHFKLNPSSCQKEFDLKEECINMNICLNEWKLLENCKQSFGNRSTNCREFGIQLNKCRDRLAIEVDKVRTSLKKEKDT